MGDNRRLHDIGALTNAGFLRTLNICARCRTLTSDALLYRRIGWLMNARFPLIASRPGI
ncbi:hypothetical protein [Caballeronia mineralivorans]|jgi:hypothetical protein|uniref:hypothetical protein n=1 Tax=Caballeronia mineralivorans TaxID=2010198 RepID=UPI0023F23882|nr:hypothetical protein [Caballeronia mineralivorans]